MSSEPPPDARSRATALVGVALPALAAAVAVGVAATGAGLLLPGARPGGVATFAIRAGGVALAVSGLALLVTRWGGAARVPWREVGPVLAAAAATLAAVTALTFGFSPAEFSSPDGDRTTTTSTTTAPTTTSVPTTSTTTPTEQGDPPWAGWDLVPLVAALVVAATLLLVAYVLVRLLGIRVGDLWRAAPPPDRQVAAPPLDVAAAEAGLASSLDAVMSDEAPRDAIAEAYARLLAALDQAGAGRRGHEAPHEHLHRVLTPLGVQPEPLHRLAGLFVLARFSQHPVTAAHRDQARDALRRALADLRQAETRRQAAEGGVGATA